MHYLLDELHAYEHDYSGALHRVSHNADPSLAGDHALCAPASRKELASFQTSIMASVKGVRGALTSLDAKMDVKVGHIENMLQGLTEAITGACPSPIPIPSSGGHPPAYPVLSGMPLWSFFRVAADC